MNLHNESCTRFLLNTWMIDLSYRNRKNHVKEPQNDHLHYAMMRSASHINIISVSYLCSISNIMLPPFNIKPTVLFFLGKNVDLFKGHIRSMFYKEGPLWRPQKHGWWTSSLAISRSF